MALQPRAPGLSQGVRSDLVGRSSSEGWRQALCLSSHPGCRFWLWRCRRGHVDGGLAFRNMVLVLFPDDSQCAKHGVAEAPACSTAVFPKILRMAVVVYKTSR